MTEWMDNVEMAIAKVSLSFQIQVDHVHHPSGVRKQGLHLRRIQEGKG